MEKEPQHESFMRNQDASGNSTDLEAGDDVALPSNDSDTSGGGRLRLVKNSTPMERVAGGIAATSVGTSVIAMILQGSPIVYVAGALSSSVGPYAYWQQTQLTDIAALKETHEAVQREVERLSAENDRLARSVSELTETVDRLEDVEQALDAITETQGQSVEAFASQVEDNRKILAKMQKNLRANVLQNLLSVIIRSDIDGDFTIDDAELDNLITRINRINGVEVHEGRFRKAIVKSGGSLEAVMDVVKNLLSDETPSDDAIFSIVDED